MFFGNYCTGALRCVSGCKWKHHPSWIWMVSCMVCWTHPQLILTTRPLSPRKLLRQHQRHQRQQLLAEFDNQKIQQIKLHCNKFSRRIPNTLGGETVTSSTGESQLGPWWRNSMPLGPLASNRMIFWTKLSMPNISLTWLNRLSSALKRR